MTKWLIAVLFVVALAMALPAHAAENLKLNQHLDYTSDSQDGPLIAGDHLEDGTVSGKPAYAIFYGEGCFNSKRQARRTVELYEKYKGRVQFVVVSTSLPGAGRVGEEILQRIHSTRGRAESRRQDRVQRFR